MHLARLIACFAAVGLSCTSHSAAQELVIEPGEFQPRIIQRPLRSSRTISLRCNQVRVLEFGALLKHARKEQGLPLYFPVWDVYDQTGNLDLDEYLMPRQVTLDLDRVPFWDGVARISKATQLGIERTSFTDAFSLVRSPYPRIPARHWVSLGPILGRVELGNADWKVEGWNPVDPEDAKPQESDRRAFKLYPMSFDDEAQWNEMSFGDVTLVMKSGERHAMKLSRDNGGSWWGELPTDDIAKIAAVTGHVTAMVSTEIIEVDIAPGTTCSDMKLGMQATASAVGSSKSTFERPGIKYTLDEGKTMYFADLEISWPHRLSEAEMNRLSALENVERAAKDIEVVRQLLQKAQLFRFRQLARWSIGKQAAEKHSRWRKDVFWEDNYELKAEAPQYITGSVPGKITLTWHSTERDQVDAPQRIFLARRGILDQAFTVPINGE